MGWTVEGSTVEIHAQGAEGALQATSTSTVALGPADVGGAAARLRLYGVDDQMVTRSLPAARAWGRQVASNPCGARGPVISYLDALAPFRFVIDGAMALGATCVPAGRSGVSWPVKVGGSLRTLAMNVSYKDPTVVRLPDASWLMVLARYRTLASSPGEQKPGRSVGDVVAWRAADPGFSQKLTGPYWLVDGQHALPDQAKPAWLGVPSAVVAGQGADLRLDVYFAYHTDDTNGRSYLEQALDPSPAPRAPVVTPPGGSPKQGVGVKRFRWADLAGTLAIPSAPEAGWESIGALPGTLLGRARVWAASDLPGMARPFEEAFSQVRVVDPAPIACPGAPDLFFAAIHEGGPQAARGPQDAHGIWHATALPTGALVCAAGPPGAPCSLTTAVEGLDFLVAAGGTGSRSRLAATGPGNLYLDPDPVRLPAGGLRVAAGNVEAADGLTWMKGAASDVCQPWGMAWAR